MALTKIERNALQKLADYITLQRASLTPPDRAIERGYKDGIFHGPQMEDRVRPFPSRVTSVGDVSRSNEWTNDVAESLRIYTESWILPIIDELLAEGETPGQRRLRSFHLEDLSRS